MPILTTSTSISPGLPAPAGTVRRISTVEQPEAPKSDDPIIVLPKQAAMALEQVQQAVERLKQSLKPALINALEFEIDESTGKTVVKILDAETHTLVRQIPSEELLAIAEALDRMQSKSGLVEEQV